MKNRLVPIKVIICVSSLLFLVVGCDKLASISKKPDTQIPAEQDAIKTTGTVVAKVNGVPITLEDLNEDIKNFNAMVPTDKPEMKITTRDQKVSYLKEEMVRKLLLSQESAKRGLARNEEVVKALDKYRAELLVMEIAKQELSKIDVTPKEIEDYYNTYKDQLKVPEERRIREIVVPAEAEANEILVQLLQGADFAAKAADRSKATSAKSGGDSGFIRADNTTRFPKFMSIAFSDTLDVGKVSNVFKGPDGFYIIKIEEKRGGEQKTLQELWDDIKRALTFLKQQEKINGLIGKLTGQSKIEILEGEIK